MWDALTLKRLNADGLAAVLYPSRNNQTMYLLDTNLVSELRKIRPHGAVVAWIKTVSDTDVSLSAVTLGERQSGVEMTREQDAKKAAEIAAWLD
jgi:hypothetical protein